MVGDRSALTHPNSITTMLSSSLRGNSLFLGRLVHTALVKLKDLLRDNRMDRSPARTNHPIRWDYNKWELQLPFLFLYLPAAFWSWFLRRRGTKGWLSGFSGYLGSMLGTKTEPFKKCLGKQFLTTLRTSLMLNVPLILILRQLPILQIKDLLPERTQITT